MRSPLSLVIAVAASTAIVAAAARAARATLPAHAPVIVGAASVERAAEIDVRLFRFAPDTLRVSAGARVAFLNHDEIAHTATAGTAERPDGRFDVALTSRGSRGEVVLDRAGTYAYHCRRHPFMQGVVDVRLPGASR